LLGCESTLAQNAGVEQGVSRKAPRPVCGCAGVRAVAQAREDAGSAAVDRFALAIGALPMLETARIGGDAGSL